MPGDCLSIFRLRKKHRWMPPAVLQADLVSTTEIRSPMAMGQKPNRTPSEHPNPTTKIGSKMGGGSPKYCKGTLGPPDLRGWNRGTRCFFLWSILVGEPSPKMGERALLGDLE